MLRRRLRRPTTAFLVMLSFLFSQVALAQYVCPPPAGIEAMAAMMKAGTPCEGIDPQQPVLCHQHAADPGKTFEKVKLQTVSLPAVVRVLELPPVREARAVPPPASFEVRPPPDPLFLSTLRLRV